MARKPLEIKINEDTPQADLELCIIAAERTSDPNIQRQASKATAEIKRRELEREIKRFNDESVERVKAQKFQEAQTTRQAGIADKQLEIADKQLRVTRISAAVAAIAALAAAASAIAAIALVYLTAVK